jgi:hypothetical protein
MFRTNLPGEALPLRRSGDLERAYAARRFGSTFLETFPEPSGTSQKTTRGCEGRPEFRRSSLDIVGKILVLPKRS